MNSEHQVPTNHKEFQPYIKPNQTVREFTTRAIILGILLAIVFGAANAYVGLKVGMTISASIPAAVISMAVLRGLFRKGTVLENNMVMAIGSSGESLAAGIIFTIPALIFLGFSPTILEMFIMSALGGCLGILLMIPLRRYLIVQEHNKLPYPEGTACAKILIAGEQGGARAKLVFGGVILGAIYKFLMGGLGLWKSVVGTKLTFSKQPLVGTAIGADATPILLGVGYIIGLRIAALMFAGAVLGWLVLIPLIKYFGSDLTYLIPPADKLISGMSSKDIWSNYIRYLGAGGVVLGGAISLIKVFPVIIKSFKQGIASVFARKGDTPKSPVRTEHDIPMKYVIIISLLLMLGVWIFLGIYKQSVAGIPFNIFKTLDLTGLIGTILVVIFGFFFVTVAARIVGIVGSSSSPVSGMTLTALMATALVFVAFGWTDNTSMALAMCVGAIICIAVCMSGDISQDLKTGYIVGGTPFKMQISEFIGVFAPAIAIAWVLLLLNDTYGMGPGKELEAPQATLLSMVLKGVIQANLPWTLIIVGIFIGLMVELLGIASLPFAIGLYLPFKLSAPIIMGGFLAWVVSRITKPEARTDTNEKGILFSSGLVAGDALMGIIIALLASIPIGVVTLADKLNIRGEIPDTTWEHILGFGIFIALAIVLVIVIKWKKKSSRCNYAKVGGREKEIK